MDNVKIQFKPGCQVHVWRPVWTGLGGGGRLLRGVGTYKNSEHIFSNVILDGELIKVQTCHITSPA